jgi:Protease inhibitor Inh
MPRAIIILFTLCLAGAASAQAPPLNNSAQAMIGAWEFSNAERDKICTATFKNDPTSVGYQVAFDANCAKLFPLVADVAGWKYPENDLLYLLNARGEALAEFSEVEDGIFEAPTPGVGVLFLQKPGAANPPALPPEQVAGHWTLKRGDSTVLCTFALTLTTVADGHALSVGPGCDAAIAKLGFTQWRLDKGELVLAPATGAPWRFEQVDNDRWARLPESVDEITLVRQ